MMGGNSPVSTAKGTSAVTIPDTTKNIDMTYTRSGLNPNEITVKKGQTYTISIDVKDTVSGCMHMIVIP